MIAFAAGRERGLRLVPLLVSVLLASHLKYPPSLRHWRGRKTLDPANMTVVLDEVAQSTVRRAGTPVVFGPADRPLFGFYHAPDTTMWDGPARSVAVVLCNALAYEAMSAHRSYLHLAERLAARGFPVLRFDYDGTGDSAGDGDDPGRVRAWMGSIQAALGEARARSGAPRFALFGVRFGATLAALAAGENPDVESLIVWAPIVSGRAHVRDLRAFRLMKKHGPKVALSSDGSEEIGGYVFGPETLNDMAAVNLLGACARTPQRVLILARNAREGDLSRLADAQRAQGADVRLVVEAGYARMMRDDPYDALVPVTTLDTIVDWLAESEARSEPLADPLSAGRTLLTFEGRGGRGLLKETPMLLGKTSSLFAFLTEPEAPASKDRPVLCFLNVGANHHVGPHRMNVDLAREFAFLGYRTLRLDVAGLGDSPAIAGQKENRIYTKDSVEDVQSVMTALSTRVGAHRFVLVGLCSGAYLAYHTAVADARVVGQVLLSPYAFEWKEGDPVTPTARNESFRSTRFYRRSLWDSRSWRRLLRGDVNVRAISKALLQRFRRRVDEGFPSIGDLVHGRLKPQNEVERAFIAMSERGVKSLMVLSFEDGGLEMVARYLGSDASKMWGRKNFSFRILDGADHTFTSVASKQALREMLGNYVNTNFR